MKAQAILRPQPTMLRLLPMEVREVRTFKSGFTYAVCPRCGLSMEREFVRYCSNCGQRLSWNQFEVPAISVLE